MADTLTRLAGPLQLAAAAATIYTVPALTTTVIRMIHLSNPTTADKTVTISIGADAAATRILDAYVIPAGSVFSYPCNFTMTAAEILQAFCSSATSVVVVVNGIEVT
jgi:hypothetical protein